VRRALLLLALVLGLIPIAAIPAAAHGAGGVEATSYVGSVGGITPALPGARLRVVEPGPRLELRNDGPEVIVLGERGEPYLRVGPEGTFENRRSPDADRNRSPEHHRAPGPSDPGAPPDWRKLGNGPVVRWHDHRLHWVGVDPPQVTARPGLRQDVLNPSTLALRRGAETATATVRLAWVPGPSPAPWLALGAVAFFAVAALGLLRRWRGPLIVAIGLLLAVDLLHAAAAAFATVGGLGSHLARVVTGDFYAIVGWLLAATALRLLARGRLDGLYAAVFAGLSICLFGGVLDLAVLSRSATLFVLPVEVARACIALAAGGGAGLVVACVLVIRRTPEARVVLGGPDTSDLEVGGPVPSAPPGRSGRAGPNRGLR